MAFQRHKILNGQYVSIEQTPASIGHRMGAYGIDMIVLYAYSYIQIALAPLYQRGSAFDTYLIAIIILIPVFYHPVCEQLWGGSIGKLALGMRVVMQNGEPVSIGASILRWLLYLLDCPFGLLAMMCNKRNMRLGDLAAGSIVISTRSESQRRKLMQPMQRFTYLAPDYKPTLPFAAELTWGQVNFINHTMKRPNYNRYAPNQKANIERLARMLADRYHIEGVTPANSNSFLQRIVADYNFYTWADTV